MERLLLGSNTNCARRFQYEDNNISFMHVQPHYYRVRQVEPCHHSGEVARHMQQPQYAAADYRYLAPTKPDHLRNGNYRPSLRHRYQSLINLQVQLAASPQPPAKAHVSRLETERERLLGEVSRRFL